MEVNFAPETEKRLADLAAQTGWGTADALVQNVIQGYFTQKLGLDFFEIWVAGQFEALLAGCGGRWNN